MDDSIKLSTKSARGTGMTGAGASATAESCPFRGGIIETAQNLEGKAHCRLFDWGIQY
jgi:hypothetical protein